jgi:hypothetical protein
MAHLVAPILLGEADYAKGNRFTSISHLTAMPSIRVFGNAALSFAAKMSTGYWNIFDPTNGYTAIEAQVARMVAEKRVSRRFSSRPTYSITSARCGPWCATCRCRPATAARSPTCGSARSSGRSR